MWKWIIGVGIVLVAVVGGLVFFMFKGPDLAQYEPLKEPRITAKADAYVLEVPFEVPAGQLQEVFGVLMKTYFSLSGVPKGPGMSAPAARYENMLDMSLPPEERLKQLEKSPWKGSAAIPVPATVQSLPPAKAGAGLAPRLGTWAYGEVAEILHVGPYDTESETIQKLTDYIAAQGYEIAGPHEEEYLRGPGMPFTSPKDYYTIIRYQVRKKAEM
ncbi:MAG: GyrI-like domain-containing protein [candidate division FCPU426 bacterium]